MTLQFLYLHGHQHEPVLPKGSPQQSRGCEGSDDTTKVFTMDTTLPRLTRLAMSNDLPHTTPHPLS
ncbi:hypothetical protein E2C01_031263 [Portunus trituberculatus]|uniref:Uncharacterized protein n=1 Tax=Portunus trituberculatus TaxID=210409 RepID=A0A5B7EY47_PORTR|nr:hypothetical protein [Portunus trituberculatus]